MKAGRLFSGLKGKAATAEDEGVGRSAPDEAVEVAVDLAPHVLGAHPPQVQSVARSPDSLRTGLVSRLGDGTLVTQCKAGASDVGLTWERRALPPPFFFPTVWVPFFLNAPPFLGPPTAASIVADCPTSR